MSIQIPLSLPRDLEEIQVAFAGDCMGRNIFAEKITPAIQRLAVNGGVLTLDAPWGEGKSWFGRHWRKMLDDQENVRTCWVDAFEQDYIEDPFELVASELIDAMDWRENEELIKKTVSVLRFAEKTFGAVAKVCGRGLGGVSAAHQGGGLDGKVVEETANAVTDFIAQGVSDGTVYLKEKLLSHSYEKKAIRAFRKEVQTQLAAQKKPLVVFVDELDRCRPDFAVRLLECIKHFFDMSNLVFVLLLNSDQLEKAVKGIYGSEVDAHLYLQKFIHLPLRLPKGGGFQEGRLTAFINALFYKRFGYTQNAEHWQVLLTISARGLSLSLRDLERVVSLLTICPLPPIPIVAFAVCLKVKSDAWFSGCRRGDKGVWEGIRRYMQMQLGQDLARFPLLSGVKDFMEQWLDETKEIDVRFLSGFGWGESVRECYNQWLDSIDAGYDTVR